MRLRPITLAIATLFTLPASASDSLGDAIVLDEVVVTAPRMLEPLTVVNDPKAPQQPVPANDGAAFLKNIPGFALIRKGGTDGDPVLRGLAGSRLNILVDGAEFHGGCGMRMDPPTAYVFPETFDKVTVIKGPQTVLHGNGNLAGVALFEHDTRALARPGARGFASLMGGTRGRFDAMADGRVASDSAYLQATASHAESDDYKNGDGNKVHALYERQAINLIGGFRLDATTRIEFSAVGSQAEAAYADRGMDGVKFDREGYGLKFEKTALSPVLRKITAQVNTNYIDHVMDNYSLRTNANCGAGTNNTCSVNNPDRETNSAKATGTLALSETTQLDLGLDWQANTHTLRKIGNATLATASAYTGRPRIRDMDTERNGLFAELRHEMSANHRLIGGLRHDAWSAERFAYPTGNFVAKSDANLTSGFVRLERDLADKPATVFIGLGHAERPMDFWEASTYNGLTATRQLDPEKNTQLDTGVIWQTAELTASASLFYSRIEDYILTRSLPNCTMLGNCESYNVDATRYGGEADLAWRFAPQWTLRGSLAWVRADNDTMNTPLAQTPPLEARLGLDYSTGPWTLGGVLRLVAEQDRIHPGYGNIVGQDLTTATDGFATLALNAAFRPNKVLLLTAGIDNVFDRNYAEHISRSGAAVPGYEQTARVNEPGRFFWLKLSHKFD